jgi:hypothetical protein
MRCVRLAFCTGCSRLASWTLVLWKVKGRRAKSLSALAVIALFGWLPAKQAYEAQQRYNYSREAWAYFKKCAMKGPERRSTRPIPE